MSKPTSIDEYISSFPQETQKLLQQMRTIIKETTPGAQEVISYGMPAMKLNGMLVWFGAHSNHIGLYPGASAIAAFKNELSAYKNAKGSVQFPFNKPLPAELITKMVVFRVAENLQKAKAKK